MVLVQMTIAPISEFQSQLALWLARDFAFLNASQVQLAASLWHAGILVAVLVGGLAIDATARAPGQGWLVLAAPIVCNAALFGVAYAGAVPHGGGALPVYALVFLLGATMAPAYYLGMSRWCKSNVPQRLMPIVSSVIDVFGSVGAIIMLQLQKSAQTATPPADSVVDDSASVAAANKLGIIMRYLGLAGLLAAVFLVTLFAMECKDGGGVTAAAGEGGDESGPSAASLKRRRKKELSNKLA
jgi:hypothetical protein